MDEDQWYGNVLDLIVLTNNIADSITYAKSTRQMWLELEEIFSQINEAKLYQAQKEMCNVSQGTSDIATYFTKVTSLWDQLDDPDEIPTCTCVSTKKILWENRIKNYYNSW